MGLINYIRDTRGEMKHVSWPTRKQAIVFSLVVIIISVGMAFFLGFFDLVFSLVLEKLLI